MPPLGFPVSVLCLFCVNHSDALRYSNISSIFWPGFTVAFSDELSFKHVILVNRSNKKSSVGVLKYKALIFMPEKHNISFVFAFFVYLL